MCQNNYTTKKKKYKHLSYAERTMIERWHNKDKKGKKEIAELLGKSERTMRREINRGLVKNLMSDLREIWVYSADVAEDKYQYYLRAKGPMLKLDNDIKLVKHIENEIIVEKKSPEAIVMELPKNGFRIEITAKTVRNAIKLGTVFQTVKTDKIIYQKSYNNKNKSKRIARTTPPEKSIEHRPKEANTREEYGHWEGDLVIGKKGTRAALFTLTERMTREEIIFKISSKENKNVCKCLNILERGMGSKFYSKFKTITFDNGGEFKNYEGIEKSCLRKKQRTSVFYAHPYCSGERGSNENGNRMIRRWIPKGMDMTEITVQFVKQIQDWMNNYPRAMFDYKSSNMVLSNI